MTTNPYFSKHGFGYYGYAPLAGAGGGKVT